MLKPVNKLLILFFFCSCLSARAQVYYSPSSNQGLGDILSSSSVAARGMGDIGQTDVNENRFSLANPASYSNLNTFTFDAAFSAQLYNIKAPGISSYSQHDFSVPYLALGLPVWPKKKVGLTVSLLPYNKIGYQFRYDSAKNIHSQELTSGDGGLTRFQVGASVELFKNFRLGVNGAYVFGKMNATHTVSFPDSANYFGIVQNSSTVVGDFLINAGLQYKIGGDTQHFQVGATVNMPASFGTQRTIEAYTSGLGYPVSDSLVKYEGPSTKLSIPIGYSIGLKWQQSMRLSFFADLNYMQWSRFTGYADNVPMKDYSSAALGLQFTPMVDVNGTSSFLRKITYRMGVRYANTQYTYNNTQVPDARFSVGIGLPMPFSQESKNFIRQFGDQSKLYKYMSYIDLSAEFGQSGFGLEQKRNYVNLLAGIHVSDIRWFKRQKLE